MAISLVSAAASKREELEKERVSQRLFVFFVFFSFSFLSICVVSREEGKLLLSAGFLKKILLICFRFFVCVFFFCSGGFFQFLI